MNEELAKIIEFMLRKIDVLGLMYSVVDELVKIKPVQCPEIECHKCDLYPGCDSVHKFLSGLNEMAGFHLVSLAGLLRKRLEELKDDVEEKENC